MKKLIKANEKTVYGNEIKKEAHNKKDQSANNPALSVDEQLMILAEIIADTIINEINNNHE